MARETYSKTGEKLCFPNVRLKSAYLLVVAAYDNSMILSLWRWTDGFTLNTFQGRFLFFPSKVTLDRL
jgi:hypothetical protein